MICKQFFCMSVSPNSSLVQHTIELNYANSRRSNAIKWIIVNITIVLFFVFDLSRKCPGHTQALHYAELCAVAALSANS
ncbi:hypothetical protein B5X24_HaOG204872 [Helicoverpa armigera]|uniref:Uncharacterized protein n=1 Tax=Helicoverpa armigera TaxID=29058 RepID=A0A2W1BM88_HELAM|nr:hypothetical protein B5X24_HaOG204872 [Helicoverpa armigera]